MIVETLQTVIAFIITLGIIVTIHEFGHFWVARRCGIKVLKFSIGFGTPLLKWKDKTGTEFILAAIPLGGYVKMLDEREAPVVPHEVHLAFNQQPLASRIAVVIAGPLANFITAIVFLWLMYIIGIHSAIPVIGRIIPDSPAAVAGLTSNEEIVSINGKTTNSWSDVNLELLPGAGKKQSYQFITRPFYGEIDNQIVFSNKTLNLLISNWQNKNNNLDPLAAAGIIPFSPRIPAIIDKVIKNEPAYNAGIMKNDHILSINTKPISDWLDFVTTIQKYPNQPVDITIKRDSETIQITVTPLEKTTKNGQKTGYIGASVQPVTTPNNYIRHTRKNIFDALSAAINSTYTLSSLTLSTIQKMLVGIISPKQISGPITIAKVAGQSITLGVSSYLYFLAMLSISLGVINLLPIPMLDGGHLLFYVIELIRGRPLQEKTQMLGIKIGFLIILSIMVLALYNDFNQL